MNPYDDEDTVDELPAQPRKNIPTADLELLTLAARAIGALQIELIEGEQWINLHFADGRIAYGWNSLLFSDDAFELVVRLQMQFSVDDGLVTAGCSEAFAEELNQADPSAAGRLAITRVAAEIGKTMA